MGRVMGRLMVDALLVDTLLLLLMVVGRFNFSSLIVVYGRHVVVVVVVVGGGGGSSTFQTPRVVQGSMDMGYRTNQFAAVPS